jgi:hypothetical protein
VAGAAHLKSKILVRAAPTTMRSACATPKEAADIATCSMKYPTSAAERSMNLLLSAEIHIHVQKNVLVDLILGGVASVGRESIFALHGASEEDTEVLVQVGKESAGISLARIRLQRLRYSLLVGRLIHGGHVLYERSSSTTIEEVDSTTDAAASVCGSKTAVEVWGEVDLGAVVHALGEDTWDLDADIWLGVCDASEKASRLQVEGEHTVTDDGSVDDESQESLLVGSSVVHQQSSGVVVADGHV